MYPKIQVHVLYKFIHSVIVKECNSMSVCDLCVAEMTFYYEERHKISMNLLLCTNISYKAVYTLKLVELKEY